MNFYDDLVMQTQRNYSNYYPINASGSTPYPLTDKNRCRTVNRFNGWCRR